MSPTGPTGILQSLWARLCLIPTLAICGSLLSFPVGATVLSSCQDTQLKYTAGYLLPSLQGR